MKLERTDAPPIVIGKRITIGAAISSVIAAIAHFYPQHAPALLSLSVPITFAIQVWVAHHYGITT